jgi:hypothetical protein
VDSTASAAASWTSRSRRTERSGRELTSHTALVQPHGLSIPFGLAGITTGVGIRAALARNIKDGLCPLRVSLTTSSMRRDTGHA